MKYRKLLILDDRLKDKIEKTAEGLAMNQNETIRLVANAGLNLKEFKKHWSQDAKKRRS